MVLDSHYFLEYITWVCQLLHVPFCSLVEGISSSKCATEFKVVKYTQTISIDVSEDNKSTIGQMELIKMDHSCVFTLWESKVVLCGWLQERGILMSCSLFLVGLQNKIIPINEWTSFSICTRGLNFLRRRFLSCLP